MKLACLLAALVALGTTQPLKPRLILKAYPMIAIKPTVALLALSLEGPEEEKYYCPEVEWRYAELKATESMDCPPWETRDEYPRRWTRRQGFGCGEWPIRATISKADKALLVAEVIVRIVCD